MRLKSVLLLTIATAIAVLPRDGFAVECRDVLFTQVTNKIETNEILNRAFAKKLNLCDLKSEDDCNTQSWNAGISVVVPKLQIPLGLKGGSAKEQCRSLYAQYCRSEDASEVESRSIRTARSLLDVDVAKAVIAAWQKCVEKTSTELKLFTIRPIPNEFGEFIRSIRFADQRPDASWPVISKIEPGDAVTCRPDSLESVIGAQGKSGATQLICNRTSLEKGVLIVRTTWGVESVEIPRGPQFQWKHVDGQNQGCNRNDIACTEGAEPKLEQYNAQRVGQMAVCWSNNPAGYPFSSCPKVADWCTYKNKSPNSCKGQGPEGAVYECMRG